MQARTDVGRPIAHPDAAEASSSLNVAGSSDRPSRADALKKPEATETPSRTTTSGRSDARLDADTTHVNPTSWLRDRDQLTLAVLLAIALTVLCRRWYGLVESRPDGLIVEHASESIGYRIELNSATWIELSQLEGVGPILAKRIVADRDQNGPFRSIDDLQRVAGIGPKTLERNRRWLQVRPEAIVDP
ncbi:hypothetical protein GC176_02780 [bacterium]|nr:hypothetical protein [bacterium]